MIWDPYPRVGKILTRPFGVTYFLPSGVKAHIVLNATSPNRAMKRFIQEVGQYSIFRIWCCKSKGKKAMS